MSDAEAARKAVLAAEMAELNKEYSQLKRNWKESHYPRIREIRKEHWDRKLEIQTMEIKHAKRSKDMPSVRDKDNNLCLIVEQELKYKIRRQGWEDCWTMLHKIHELLVELFEAHYTRVKATASSFTCDKKVHIKLDLMEKFYDETEIIRITLLEDGTAEDETRVSNILQDILLNVPYDWREYVDCRRSNMF